MIKLIATGGTIDAANIKENGEYEFKSSYVSDFLHKNFGHCLDVNSKELFLKDSTKITYIDRIKIVEELEKTEEKLILISHGTDTMVDTAFFINRHIKDKIIVMVGSMVPMAIDPREASFNIGFAIGKLTTLKRKGVYIAMNAKLFKHNNVVKNKQLQCFEELKR